MVSARDSEARIVGSIPGPPTWLFSILRGKGKKVSRTREPRPIRKEKSRSPPDGVHPAPTPESSTQAKTDKTARRGGWKKEREAATSGEKRGQKEEEDSQVRTSGRSWIGGGRGIQHTADQKASDLEGEDQQHQGRSRRGRARRETERTEKPKKQ